VSSKGNKGNISNFFSLVSNAVCPSGSEELLLLVEDWRRGSKEKLAVFLEEIEFDLWEVNLVFFLLLLHHVYVF